MIETGLIKAKKQLEDLFAALEGVHDKSAPGIQHMLHARWCVEAAQDAYAVCGISIEHEIVAAVTQELVTEVTQQIVRTFEQVAFGNVLSRYDAELAKNDTSNVATIENGVDKAVKTMGATWAIISPTTHTLIGDYIVKPVEEADRNAALFYCGTYRNVQVYINQYGTDNTPMILGAPGAFEIRGDAITIGPTLIDHRTFEVVKSFLTDYEVYSVDGTKIGLITIDTHSTQDFS